jgi:hypothetical protein
MKRLIVLLCFLTTPFIFAEGPSFDDITNNDLDNISKEFSANFVHRAVSPASTLGDIFGFEVGIIAGVTDAPDIAAITQREDPTNSDPFDKIAHAGLYGSVSVPFSLTAELVLLPEREIGDVTLSHTSFGLKWTFSDMLPIPLIDLALKGHFSTSEMSFSDTVDSVNTTVTLDNTTYGVSVLASANLLVFEPFAGVGYITRETDLGATGSAQIFDTTFSASQSASVDGSSGQFFAGVQVNLLLMKIAAQYENVFGTSVTSAKLTIGF